MSQNGLNLFIPMELLINSLNALSLSQKREILRILDDAITQDEETTREIKLVSDEYANGNDHKSNNIKQQLKQGAIQRAERDLELVDEWFNLEEEAC